MSDTPKMTWKIRVDSVGGEHWRLSLFTGPQKGTLAKTGTFTMYLEEVKIFYLTMGSSEHLTFIFEATPEQFKMLGL